MTKRRTRSPGPAKQTKRAPRAREIAVELAVHRAELEAQNASLRDANREIERSRDRYAEMFDFAPIAYLMLDDFGIIRHLNFAAASLLGVTRMNLVGGPLLNAVKGEDRAQYVAHLARCRRTGARVSTELELRIKGGTGHYTSVPVLLLTTTRMDEGRTPEFFTTVLDLRDRRLAEERAVELIRESALREDAERSSRAKDEFFALLAHELRTPLNAIHGWTHLLATGRLSKDEQCRAVEVIARNVHVQTRLIDDMLDLSRVVRGAIQLEKLPVDPVEMVATAVDGIRPAAHERQLHLEVELDPITARLAGDRERLAQVIANLLSNAIKFTPAGGRITVRLQRGLWRSPRIGRPARDPWGECARLSVSDTGRGIPREELTRVFDRFWRGRSSPARELGGLGIGLSIAQRLVDMHDGDIWVESDGEGAGSTFFVELPLEAPGVRPVVDRPSLAAPARRLDLHGVRILLVDDDADALDIVRRELEPLGARVTAVSSAREAYETIQKLRPDLLVSDLAMPDEDGLSLIQRIRQLPSDRGGFTPAVALTAWAGAGDEHRVLEAGFQTYVAKPVDAERLGELIGSIVGHKAP